MNDDDKVQYLIERFSSTDPDQWPTENEIRALNLTPAQADQINTYFELDAELQEQRAKEAAREFDDAWQRLLVEPLAAERRLLDEAHRAAEDDDQPDP